MFANMSFPYDYEIELDVELPPMPNKIKQLYYPGATEQSGKNGLVIKIRPACFDPWIGIFAREHGVTGYTGVLTHPDRRYVCVISSGVAYIVRTDNPQIWEQVRGVATGIKDVALILKSQLILFADNFRIAAYGKNGRIWESDTISFDSPIRIIKATPEVIRGIGKDMDGREVEFTIDTLTGG